MTSASIGMRHNNQLYESCVTMKRRKPNAFERVAKNSYSWIGAALAFTSLGVWGFHNNVKTNQSHAETPAAVKLDEFKKQSESFSHRVTLPEVPVKAVTKLTKVEIDEFLRNRAMEQPGHVSPTPKTEQAELDLLIKNTEERLQKIDIYGEPLAKPTITAEKDVLPKDLLEKLLSRLNPKIDANFTTALGIKFIIDVDDYRLNDPSILYGLMEELRSYFADVSIRAIVNNHEAGPEITTADKLTAPVEIRIEKINGKNVIVAYVLDSMYREHLQEVRKEAQFKIPDRVVPAEEQRIEIAGLLPNYAAPIAIGRQSPDQQNPQQQQNTSTPFFPDLNLNLSQGQSNQKPILDNSFFGNNFN